MARCDHLARGGIAGERDAHERVHRLAAAGVVLAHADELLPGTIDGEVRVEERSLGRERLRRAVAAHAIHTLIAEVREVDDAVGDRVCAAAILVDARPHVHLARRDVRDRPVRGTPDERVAAALERAAFEPVDVVAIHGDGAEPQAGRRNRGSAERRDPGTVRCYRWGHISILRLAIGAW